MRYANTAAVLAAVCGTAVGATGAIISWNVAGGGSFSTASNWNPVQVPGTNDDVVFGLAGSRAVTFDVGGVRSLAFRAGTVTTGGSGPSFFTTGVNVEVGQVAGDVATWNSKGAFDVGGSVILGRDAGSTGTMTLDGAFLSTSGIELASTTGDLIVGSRGAGTLDVGDGNISLQDDVIVGFVAGSVGEVSISGSAGTVPVFGDFVVRGRITSTGPNSDMLVGNSGHGTLSITSGGLVDITGTMAIGRSAGSTGEVTVSGLIGNLVTPTLSEVRASRLDIGANTFAGPVGGTGSLTIAARAKVTIDGPTTIGDPDGGGTATLRIQSLVGQLVTHDFIDRGNVTQMQGGTLVVRGNYLASAGTDFWVKGTGFIGLDGPSARLDASAPVGQTALRVGDTASITLQAEDGGVISVTSGNVVLGASGGTGQLEVGSGGLLSVADDIVVSQGGLLDVRTLGSAAAGACRVGTAAGENGAITINGALSAARVVVGEHASAGLCSLTVFAAGEVIADELLLPRSGSELILLGGLVQSANEIQVRGSLEMSGGVLRCPQVSLQSAVTHHLAGRIEGRLLIAGAPVTCEVSDLVIATPGTPVTNIGVIDIFGTLDVQGPIPWFLNNATIQPTGRVISSGTARISAAKTLHLGGVVEAPLQNLGVIDCFGTACRVESTVDSTSGAITGTQMTLGPAAVLTVGNSATCKLVGEAGSAVIAATDVSLGDAAASVGVDLHGSLACGNLPVSLKTSTEAFLGDTTINGGVLSCQNSAGTGKRIRLRGELSGSGTVRGQAVFNNAEGGGSSVRPRGLLSIEGAYSQLTDGTSLAGTLRGEVESRERFDQLVVTGTARLGGTLSYRPAPGFVQTSREELTIVRAGERSGVFQTLDLPRGWSVEYTPTSVILVILCPADFNGDGGVDGDDVIGFFERWDAGDIGADFNGDGGVDGDDVIGFFENWDGGC